MWSRIKDAANWLHPTTIKNAAQAVFNYPYTQSAYRYVKTINYRHYASNFVSGFFGVITNLPESLFAVKKFDGVAKTLLQTARSSARVFLMAAGYCLVVRPTFCLVASESGWAIWTADGLMVSWIGSHLPRFFAEDTINNLSFATAVSKTIPADDHPYFRTKASLIEKAKAKVGMTFYFFVNNGAFYVLSHVPYVGPVITYVVRPMYYASVLAESRFDASRDEIYGRLAENNVWLFGQGQAVSAVSWLGKKAVASAPSIMAQWSGKKIVEYMPRFFFESLGRLLMQYNVSLDSSFVNIVVEAFVMKWVLLSAVVRSEPFPGGEQPIDVTYFSRLATDAVIKDFIQRKQDELAKKTKPISTTPVVVAKPVDKKVKVTTINPPKTDDKVVVATDAKMPAQDQTAQQQEDYFHVNTADIPPNFYLDVRAIISPIVASLFGKDYAHLDSFVTTDAVRLFVSLNEQALAAGINGVKEAHEREYQAAIVASILQWIPDFFMPVEKGALNLVASIVYTPFLKEAVPHVERLVKRSLKSPEELKVEDEKQADQKIQTEVRSVLDHLVQQIEKKSVDEAAAIEEKIQQAQAAAEEKRKQARCRLAELGVRKAILVDAKNGSQIMEGHYPASSPVPQPAARIEDDYDLTDLPLTEEATQVDDAELLRTALRDEKSVHDAKISAHQTFNLFNESAQATLNSLGKKTTASPPRVQPLTPGPP